MIYFHITHYYGNIMAVYTNMTAAFTYRGKIVHYVNNNALYESNIRNKSQSNS